MIEALVSIGESEHDKGDIFLHPTLVLKRRQRIRQLVAHIVETVKPDFIGDTKFEEYTARCGHTAPSSDIPSRKLHEAMFVEKRFLFPEIKRCWGCFHLTPNMEVLGEK